MKNKPTSIPEPLVCINTGSAIPSMRALLCLISLGLLLGCSAVRPRTVPPGYTLHTGDFGSFLSGEVVKYGGRPSAGTVSVQRFDCRWWSKSDRNGFQILVPADCRESVEACMRQLYGEPLVSAGYPHWLYRSKNAGVTISAQTQLDPIHIIVTREGIIHDERLPIGKESNRG